MAVDPSSGGAMLLLSAVYYPCVTQYGIYTTAECVLSLMDSLVVLQLKLGETRNCTGQLVQGDYSAHEICVI